MKMALGHQMNLRENKVKFYDGLGAPNAPKGKPGEI
jgi:hypothetical protein